MSAAAKPSKPEIYVPYSNEEKRRPPVIVTPSILSSDFACEARELAKCRKARAPWIHVDIMDGHFVPNITFGPPLLKSFSASEPELFYDAHLMVEKPMQFAEPFIQAGAGLVNIHIEVTRQPRKDLRAIKAMGARCGLTLKPKTPVKAIADVLDEVDLVLVMTVEPGFGGQALIPKTINKVRELDLIRKKENLPFRLQVDGGIDVDTVGLAVAAGADVIVAGSAVFKGGDVAGNLKALRQAIDKA